MSFGSRWATKPPVGSQIDWSTRFAAGSLQFLAPCNENGGGLVCDSVTRTQLAATSAFTGWGSSGAGSCLSLTANNAGLTANVPPALKLQLPLTLIFAFRFLGTPTASCAVFGTLANNTGISPYYCYSILTASSGNQITARINIAGSLAAQSQCNATFTTGIDYVVAAELQAAKQTFYVGGLNNTVQTNNWSGSITYYPTSLMSIGAEPGLTRNPNMLFYWGGVWSGILDPSLHAAIGSSVNAIWQVYQPRRSVILSFVAPIAGASSYWGRSEHRPRSRPITGPAIPLVYG